MKEGFAASAADVPLLSAGFPKVYAGGGCSVGALGLLKEKPPEIAGAGVASASLLAAPKRKLDGADVVALCFLNMVNMEAPGALSTCNDPKVELLCGVVVAKFGSPNFAKMDPVVVVAVLVSFDGATLSLFS